jgi:hypothetical protein
MEQIKVWVGRRGTRDGYDNSRYEWVTFEGEELGRWKEYDDERGDRGVSYTIYRTGDGTIVLHRVKWSRWADEYDYGRLLEYDSLEAASDEWRYVLENAGVLPRPVLTLAEWRVLRSDEDEEE